MEYYQIAGICLFLCVVTYLLGNAHGKKAEREGKTVQSKQLAEEISTQKAEIEKQKAKIYENQDQLKALHESVNKMEYLRLQRERASDDETNALAKRRAEKLLVAEQQYQQRLDQLTQRHDILQSQTKTLEKQYQEKEKELERSFSHMKKSLEAEVNQLEESKANIEKSLDSEKAKYLHDREVALSSFERALNARKLSLDNREHSIQAVINTSIAYNPFLAQQFADCLYMADLKDADYLKYKKRPALTAAEKVQEIAAQKRLLQEQCKLQEYQLNLYESSFPWLAEFKEISTEDLQQLKSVDSAPDSEYSSLRNWLSPQEYQSLSSVERLQLALDRYSKRQKSNWQIGIEYERYVGYCYEKKGYRVLYNGAMEGLEDMGRDLIVSRNKSMFVIQCKRWAVEKTIHEKHIFQLFGTTILQKLEHPDYNVGGLFVTTTTLSDLAKSCAEYLHITVIESFPLKAYPLIKCNISKNGDKIYHLPFDQQYDRVIIDPDDGDFYASTVEEAETKGFRHAWRWTGS